MMSYWEYCEVGWTPKRITIHVYSGRSDGSYEGVQEPKEWGSVLAQLGADGWELVGIVPTRPATHTLYYFKRPLDPPEVVELEKQEKLKAEQEWRKRLEEWEKAPPGTILQLHHATIMKPIPGFNLKAALLQLHRATITKPIPKAVEPTEQSTDAERKTVMKGQVNADQISHADSSSATEPQEES